MHYPCPYRWILGLYHLGSHSYFLSHSFQSIIKHFVISVDDVYLSSWWGSWTLEHKVLCSGDSDIICYLCSETFILLLSVLLFWHSLPIFWCTCPIRVVDCVSPQRRMFLAAHAAMNAPPLLTSLLYADWDSSLQFSQAQKMRVSWCVVQVVSFMWKDFKPKLCKCVLCLDSNVWVVIAVQWNYSCC
jgi:hypothetical protein